MSSTVISYKIITKLSDNNNNKFDSMNIKV